MSASLAGSLARTLPSSVKFYAIELAHLADGVIYVSLMATLAIASQRSRTCLPSS
jgi:hypothetical protein